MKKNILFKKTFLVLIILLTCNTILANELNCIVIYLKTGNKIILSMKDYPKIVVENNKISLGTNHFSISNISKYTFENITQSIDDTNLSDDKIISLSDGHVYIKSKKSKSFIKLHTVSGKELNIETHTLGNGIIDINLTSHPIGVYLLTIDGETIKIQRK